MYFFTEKVRNFMFSSVSAGKISCFSLFMLLCNMQTGTWIFLIFYVFYENFTASQKEILKKSKIFPQRIFTS